MNKTKLFSFALAGLMLGACSNDDVVDNGSKGQATEGNGYVTLALNLPTQTGTRAANDNFDDGTYEEYAVKNGTLIIFTGKTEADAVFHSAYSLNKLNMNLEGDKKDQITSTTKITQRLMKDFNKDNKFYAVVVLNNNGTLTVSDEYDLTVNGTSFAGKKVNDLQTLALTTTAADITKDGFLMMNAPLASAQGGTVEPKDVNITVASEFDSSKIYETELEAEQNVSANIYVERAVAKVEVKSSAASTASFTTPGGQKTIKYSVQGWTLDNVNNSTYFLRNTTNDNSAWWGLASNSTSTNLSTANYRFVGGSAVATGLYRTYWAVDPNYSADGAEGAFTNYVGTAPALKGLGVVDYCLENTFDVDRQKQTETTRVIVAAQLKEGDNAVTFYVVNNDVENLYDNAGAVAAVKKAVLTNDAVEASLKANTQKDMVIGEADLAVATISGEAGTYVPKVSLTDDAKAKLKADANVEAIEALFQNLASVDVYKDGISYYPVRIKHFGDDLTPWNDGETTAPNVTSIYPAGDNRDGNYLGRYGVLRNNWYQVNVTGVTRIGYPTVPSIPGDDWDDDLDTYITVKINILSWAVRTQNVEL